MKTSELTGAALDWAVAKAEGYEITADCFLKGVVVHPSITGFIPSTNWAQGGPIIERERIRLDCPWNPGPYDASCKIDGKTAWVQGPTPLIAAMRCYVASKLGEEVDLPAGLE